MSSGQYVQQYAATPNHPFQTVGNTHDVAQVPPHRIHKYTAQLQDGDFLAQRSEKILDTYWR